MAARRLDGRWFTQVLPASPAARIALIGSTAWLVVFWAYGIARHLSFVTARLDLGDMTQALWNTAHGRFLEATTMGGETASRLGGHVDPLIAAFTPLWWIWPSPLLLVSISVIALASGALPVYWLARKHLASEQAARDFALVYLLCPLTQWNAIWDFHPVSLAIPLILYAIWFLDEDRLLPFTVFAVLAAASKEEIPLAVGLLGIWYAHSHGRKLTGAVILLVGVALTLVDFLVVIPHFSVAGANPFAGRYVDIGGTPHGILHTALTDPGRILGIAFSAHNLGYLALSTFLFGGLFFASPLLALGAVPDLAINVLSNNSNQTSLQFQYTAGIVPFLLAASVLGAARVQRRLPVAPIMLGIALVGCLIFGPLRFAPPIARAALPGNLDRQAAAGGVALIPGGAAVSASNRLAGHLSARRRIYVFPVVRDATWVVVDSKDPTYRPGKLRHALLRIRHTGSWHVEYERRSVVVLHRDPP
jgi:uncharacterized membrane protein